MRDPNVIPSTKRRLAVARRDSSARRVLHHGVRWPSARADHATVRNQVHDAGPPLPSDDANSVDTSIVTSTASAPLEDVPVHVVERPCASEGAPACATIVERTHHLCWPASSPKPFDVAILSFLSNACKEAARVCVVVPSCYVFQALGASLCVLADVCDGYVLLAIIHR